MRKFLLPLLLCVLLLPALRADDLKIDRGFYELSGFMVLSGGNVDLEFGFGQFYFDNFQIGVRGLWHDQSLIERRAFNVYSYYVIDTNTWLLPYAGASLGFGYWKLDETGQEATGGEFRMLSGLKWFVSESTALNAELSFGFSTDETFVSDDSSSDTEVAFNLGISFFF